MKYFLALLMTLWLAISLTAAKGGKKMKKIKELEAKIDVLFGLRENLQMEKNIIHERFQEIEFALQTLTENCCVLPPPAPQQSLPPPAPQQSQPPQPPQNATPTAGSVESSETVQQWVYNVTGFSSQYNEDTWSAAQVIGEPDVYPEYGDIRGTWAQKDIDANQYIELEFEQALLIGSLDIYETFHAGGISAILGKDPNGEWQQLWVSEEIQDIGESRVFTPDLQDVDFPVKEIRLEVNCSVADTWVEIDAVQMSGQKQSSGNQEEAQQRRKRGIPEENPLRRHKRGSKEEEAPQRHKRGPAATHNITYLCTRRTEGAWHDFLGGRIDEGSEEDCLVTASGGQSIALLKCECGLPPTDSWEADIRISDVCGPKANSSLPMGSPIATFDSHDAHYGNKGGEDVNDHAAIFLGCTPVKHGVKVLEQGCSIAIQANEYFYRSSDYFHRFYSIKCRMGHHCEPYPTDLCITNLPKG